MIGDYDTIAKYGIYDFPQASGDKPRNDAEFQRFLLNNFQFSFESAEPRQKEVDRLWRLFENSITKDYYNSGSMTDQEKAELFRSSILSTKAWVLAAIVTDARPRIYLNPVLTDEAFSDIQQQAQAKQLPEWMVRGIEKLGYGGFWNDILDKKVDGWWASEQMNSKIILTVVKGIVQGKAWVKIRRYGKEPCYENLNYNSVLEDPFAQTRRDRRWVYHYKYMSVRDAEHYFKLKRGSLIPDKDISGTVETHQEAGKGLPDGVKYQYPQVRVIEGHYKQEDGENPRIITFVTGQDTDGGGALVLRDFTSDYKDFIVQDLILRPGKFETEGVPIGRNLECMDWIGTRTIQQGAKNLHLCGNAYLAHEEDAIDDMERLPADVVKVPVRRVGGMQFIMPPPLTQQAQAFYAHIASMADDAASIHDVTQGRRPGGVESGRAISALQSSDVRSARPYIEALNNFLIPVARIVGQMMIQTTEKDDMIRYGEGQRSALQLPVSLAYVMGDVEAFVGPDVEIPMDRQSIANVLSNFSNVIPPQVLVRFLPLHDSDKEEILKEMDVVAQAQQQIAQMQQQMQGMAQQGQQIQGEMQKVMEENNAMKQQIQGKVMDTQGKMAINQQQAPITLAREQMRQQGNMERVIVQGAMNKEIAKIQSQNKPKAGGDGKRKS